MKIRQKNSGKIKDVFIKMRWHGRHLYLTKSARGGAGNAFPEWVVWSAPGFDIRQDFGRHYYWEADSDWEELPKVYTNEEALCFLENEATL